MCKQLMLRLQLRFKQHSRHSRRSMGRALWRRPRPLPPTLVLAVPPEGPLLPLRLMRTGTEASVLASALSSSASVMHVLSFFCFCSSLLSCLLCLLLPVRLLIKY